MKQRNCWPGKGPSNWQMELGLGNEQAHGNRFSRLPATGARPHSRAGRARWWFNQMREVVDNALEWRPAPPPPPVQDWLPGVDSKTQERN
jgi:hypothetical protein